MRRIWAHIIIAITVVILGFVSFTAIANNLNVGMEYAGGKTLTFQLSEKTVLAEGETATLLSTKDSDYNSAEDVAEIMEERLENADVDKYTIEVSGNDIVKVTLSQQDVDYTQISQLLIFNGTLTLNAYSDETDYYVSSEVFLNKNKPAYLIGQNTIFPTINIPVDVDNADYKSVVEAAWNSEPVMTKEASSEEADDAEYSNFMYLVYNFIPGVDSFSSEEFQNKVLLSFALTESEEDPIEYYEEDDGTYSLSTVLNVTDDEGTVQVDQVPTSWKNATFYVNLLNAGTYDYEVTLINQVNAEPQVESLFQLGKNQIVFGSSTFIAAACALVIVSLILVIFYKLGALSVSLTTFTSVFVGIAFLAIFGSEFNMLALTGLILLGVASLTSGLIYLNKFKDEVYRGRSMKKANSEASKKSNLPIVDVNFALIIIGAFNYLIGGSMMKSFALATVLGGLVSLILNLTVLKGFMWLDTNASKTQNKFSLFGIDESKVPSLINEEKQTYFGAYANKDFTNKAKPFGFGALGAVVVCLASILCFGLITGNVYNNSNNTSNSEIYFKVDAKEHTNLSGINSQISSILDEITLDSTCTLKLGDEKYTTAPEICEYTVLEYDSIEAKYVSHAYATYIVKVTGDVGEEVYYKGNKVAINDLFDSTNETYVIQDLEEVMKYEMVSSKAVSNDQPNVVRVIIATSAALGTIALYLLARYRLSRGLASFIVTAASAIILTGLFSLLHFINIGNYGVVGAIIGTYLTYVFSIIFMNKEREMILDDKKHDNSIANRELIMKNAVSYNFGDSLNVAIVGLYLGINFFGFGPRAFSWISVIMILGIALAFALVTFVQGPLSHAIFKGIVENSKEKPHKVRKNRQPQQKSAEPEEAVFIGIND